MKWQSRKNTKPIFILPQKYPYLTKFHEDHIQDTEKIYQENTKKYGTEIPNTDLVLVFPWCTKFMATDWHH